MTEAPHPPTSNFIHTTEQSTKKKKEEDGILYAILSDISVTWPDACSDGSRLLAFESKASAPGDHFWKQSKGKLKLQLRDQSDRISSELGAIR